jgi:predicted phosphatase
MEHFIERHNIARYQDFLKAETDPAKRSVLQQLLVEEEVKQASHFKPRE